MFFQEPSHSHSDENTPFVENDKIDAQSIQALSDSDSDEGDPYIEICKSEFEDIEEQGKWHILPPWSTVAANFPDDDPEELFASDFSSELSHYCVWLWRVPDSYNLSKRGYILFDGQMRVDWLKAQLTEKSRPYNNLIHEHLVTYIVQAFEALPRERLKNLVVSKGDWNSIELGLERNWVIGLLHTYIDVVGKGKFLSAHDVENLTVLSQHLKEIYPRYQIKTYQANLGDHVDRVVKILQGEKISLTPPPLHPSP